MTTIAILLLLVAAASTSPSPGDGARRVRDVSSGSKSGSGAMSFSSSSSGSSSGVGARTGFDGGQGYNGVNSGGFAFPDYGAAQNSYPVPVDFNALFQQYVAFMQRLAQQQAAAYNSRGGGLYYSAWTAPSMVSTPYSRYWPSSTAQYYRYGPVSTAQYYRYTPVSRAQHSRWTVPVSPARYRHSPGSSTRYYRYASSPTHRSRASARIVFGGAREINSRAGFSQPDYSGGFVFPEVPNYGPGANNYGGGFGASNNAPDAYASASASLSPRGGFGSASIGPPVQTRMGSVPPSGGGGGDFSVFSASSSSSSDIDGVKKSSKEATSVINDNGKITTYHVSNP
ncbi:uncharacterized protein [Periplaneta americana]|uniref:uncharacterized protein isoform X1 n=1 Tax=Periplaneta americana TaxID=6978 RepID=UPI0037E90746